MFYILLIVGIIVVTIIAVVILKAKRKNKRKTYLYAHHECPSYFGPHGDSLRSIYIVQTKGIRQQLFYPDKPEWEIIEKNQSDPEGACCEYIQIKEKRNNQSEWEYHICWIKDFEWLLQFDLPRILTDKTYFNEHLLKAESGDADAQTLIGSCYAHCLELAKNVVTRDEEKALYWWNKAVKQGHRYAMMELAIYYYNKKDYDKAADWNEWGNCQVSIIERHYKTIERHLKWELLREIRSAVRDAKREYFNNAHYELEQLTEGRSQKDQIAVTDYFERLENDWCAFQTFIDNTHDLMLIRPEDIEKRIGIKKMSMLKEQARRVGWGSEEYWNQLFQRGRNADHNMCLGLAMCSYENMVKDSQKIEEEYKDHPERFEDITLYKDGKPFAPSTDTDNPLIDIALVCEIYDKVAKYMETKNSEDWPNDELLEEYNYGMDLEDSLELDGICILYTLRIAVKKRGVE